MPIKDHLVTLGTVQKAHGLQGRFFLNLYNQEKRESILKKDTFVQISSDGEIYQFESLQFSTKVIGKFKNIDTREDLEEILPFQVQMRREDFPKIRGEDLFYYEDLKGLSVFDAKTKDFIGHIQSIFHNTAHDVFQITTGEGDFEIPFVENFVPKVDLDKKRVYIIPPTYI